MRDWLEANGVWLISLIFVGGVMYSQVLQNTAELAEQRPMVQQVKLLQLLTEQNTQTMKELSVVSSSQYKEFIDKLDIVITRLDQRDTAQSEAINRLNTDVLVLKQQIRQK